jgi:Cu+-exporting ATPase
MQLDPVCGQSVQVDGNQNQVEYAGESYYFCSSACLERFDQEPDLFTAGAGIGRLANADPASEPLENPRPGPAARLEQPPVDAGPG